MSVVRNSIADIVSARGIKEVVHFTTNRGLTGALSTRTLMSRPHLDKEDHLKYVLHHNSSHRAEESSEFDKSEEWIRYVNLSISEVNARFLKLCRKWRRNDDMWWAILSFRPEIMEHKGVFFTTTNNTYDQVSRGKGVNGLAALFADRVGRKQNGRYGSWSVWRGTRADNLTTCEQAEVLYPERLSLDYLQRIYVETGDHHDIVAGWLDDFGYSEQDVSVEIVPDKFRGVEN